jgi:hypothetical protein
LDNSENCYNSDKSNVTNNLSLISEVKNKDNLFLHDKYVIKLNNLFSENDINIIKSNYNKPIINNWLVSLINKNIYLNKQTQDFNLTYINNFIPFLHSNYNFKILLSYLKQSNIENKIFNISNLSYFVDTFANSKIKNGDSNFNNFELLFLESMMDMKFIEPISFEIEKKEQGTFFHNVVEIMIGYFRDKLLKDYSEILISNKYNFKNEKLLLNNENINDFVLKIIDDKLTDFSINENDVSSKYLIQIDKDIILNLFLIEIKKQLLKSFPNSIYIEFQILQYKIVARNFINILLEESKKGKYILFSELNLVEDKIKGHTFEIENLDLKIKFKGVVDLIIADFSKQSQIMDNKKTKNKKDKQIIEKIEVILEDDFQFNIYDMKFKKSEKIEAIQLYLYSEAFKSLLNKNGINNNINNLALIYLKENLNSMYKGISIKSDLLPNSYIQQSQNKLENAFNEFINNYL